MHDALDVVANVAWDLPHLLHAQDVEISQRVHLDVPVVDVHVGVAVPS